MQSAADQNSRIDTIMNRFVNFNNYPNAMEISTVMESLNRLTLTPEEFEGYLPFFEEVADVARE